MLPDPSIDVCICITILFTILFSEAVVFLFEKRLDSVSFERKGTYEIAIAKSFRLLGRISAESSESGFWANDT